MSWYDRDAWAAADASQQAADREDAERLRLRQGRRERRLHVVRDDEPTAAEVAQDTAPTPAPPPDPVLPPHSGQNAAPDPLAGLRLHLARLRAVLRREDVP